MARSETGREQIVSNEFGVPVIAGTRFKVVMLVREQIAYGWSPEELQDQHPHLTLDQVHAALAYYRDHKDELDRDIKRREALVEEMRRNAPESPFVERLRELMRLRRGELL